MQLAFRGHFGWNKSTMDFSAAVTWILGLLPGGGGGGGVEPLVALGYLL